ncbi:putative integral membrane protein [Leishmania donovani]|uniref:Putative integral membrane protein n=1 Tax=Leishmania donovani TaxID=5661 RepID=A0A504XZ58_LEIDO|nr:putative integral membrane protein [Leishmania donovani]
MVTEFNKEQLQFGYGFFLLLVAWVLDLVDIVFLLFPLPTMRSDETARQLRDDALVEEPAELIAQGLKGPDPRLASILPEVVRHSPRPPPVTHTTDVTASALEQEPGRAARLGRGMRSTRVRVAPTAQHVPEGGDEQGQDEPVRRMARLKGRQCVLGDQDVAVAQQRPPSPGLRHGAVAEVMGNATWPLRIVLRGPPRKLHHTARLLERASWLRCCAHGPRAVEAVALIPISRALCRSAVRVEGGPLAHVGVRGAEGRLRCVVEALCVKRGREVCGDAVALACATVVCAISPMAAAGVRRLGLRMIATQHAVDELFAAVHECRVSAGRRTDEKLLRSVRRWGRTALHDPAQDVCVFHHKLFHSASRCCWPQARALSRHLDSPVVRSAVHLRFTFLAFRVSKMGQTFLVYAILQLIAFLSVLIGTPLEMFSRRIRSVHDFVGFKYVNYKFGYGFFLLLVAWVLDLVDIVFCCSRCSASAESERSRKREQE